MILKCDAIRPWLSRLLHGPLTRFPAYLYCFKKLELPDSSFCKVTIHTPHTFRERCLNVKEERNGDPNKRKCNGRIDGEENIIVENK